MLRQAEPDDRDLVLRWRNHPEVRERSLDSHVISAAEHAAWWAQALTDRALCVLVYERYGVPCGVVTFSDVDTAARSACWGFYLDVDGLDQRGELLPAWLELSRAALWYAFDELRLDVLHGEVLADNAAVRAFNRRNGVREVGVREIRGAEGTRSVVRLEAHAGDVRRRRGTRTSLATS